MNTRYRLHKILSIAIIENLIDQGIDASVSNCYRYLTKDLLTTYCIRRNTSISIADFGQAIALAREQIIHEDASTLEGPAKEWLTKLQAAYKRGLFNFQQFTRRRFELLQRQC